MSATLQPLVSVIIPVYNVAKLLERCVDSVLCQTYANLEIILIDDGSTDMSGKFCDIYAKRDARIRVIHQDNAGLSAARNAGLDVMQGNYVTFVDSDDFIAPDMIATLLEPCLTKNLQLAICGFQELPPDAPIKTSTAIATQPPSTELTASAAATDSTAAAASASPANASPATNTTAPQPTPELLNPITTLTHMLCDDGFTVSAWGKLYASSLFAHIRFPAGRLYEDVGTTYKLVKACPKIAYIPTELYYYCHRPAAITNQPFSLQKLDLIFLTDKMCDDIMGWAKTQDQSQWHHLNYLTKKRRMHARFSILRQMVMLDKAQITDKTSFRHARREVVRYLRAHQNDILHNPLASKRDKLAMYSLIAGLPAFKLAWQYYSTHR